MGKSAPVAPLPVLVTEKDLPRVLVIVVLGVALACRFALYLDDVVVSDQQDTTFYHPWIGYFLIVYKLLLVLSRFFGHGTYILYEMLWGCNIAINLVVLAVFLSKPYLVGVAMAIVSGDQLCWYIDIIAYFIIGKFPIGAVKYLTYPENRSFSKTFFASHHLWFLPMCLWITKDHGGMHILSFAGSCAITAFLAFYTRLFTPFQVKVRGDDHIIYLNVNGAFEFWKDIHIGVLHVLDHRSPLLYLPYLSIVGNLVANGVPHLILLGISMLMTA
ncbi:hypothetical protein Poli38472_005386 [Pythium oligandrum]|uniref:Uncharacterized protein n=1 Tax=Pythium oligandrum TaxID=41045 RepID=A0A8K1CHV9_PYTOL|nr:hypothetical protein Poli38472_005386 [Pythium oligandrum]|eukprot:TMW62768.1 hypothetical protein Poli38472_005386 [Pythium oligandrum]